MDYSSSERTNNTFSSDEVFEKYSALKVQYEKIYRKFEACQQELYECKKSNHIASELKEHLTSELEMWQRNENKIKEEFSQRMQTMHDEMEHLRQDRWKEVEQFNHTIETLQNKIKLLEADDKMACDEVSVRQMDNSRSNEDYRRLEEENAQLRNITAEQKRELLKNLEVIEELQNNVRILNEKEHSLKLNLDNKKQELSSVTDMLHSAQNDLCELNFQLVQVKQQSNTHAAKGNSLFAEVDDKRQEMLKSYSQMRDKVLQLNRELKSKQSELDSLLCEKKSLWEEYSGQASHHDAVLSRAYERRITDLEKENDQLHREIATWYNMNLDANSSIINQWISGVLEYLKEENQRLSDSFAASSVDNLNKEKKIRDLHRQIVIWRTKAMEATAVIAQMQTLQLVEKSVSNIQDEDSPKNMSTIINKENISQIANVSVRESNLSKLDISKTAENINESLKKPGILTSGTVKNRMTKKTTFQQ